MRKEQILRSGIFDNESQHWSSTCIHTETGTILVIACARLSASYTDRDAPGLVYAKRVVPSLRLMLM